MGQGSGLKTARGRLLAWLRGEAGTMAVAAAVTLPIMMLGGAIAVDTAGMTKAKRHLQDAADTAALAGAIALRDEGTLRGKSGRENRIDARRTGASNSRVWEDKTLSHRKIWVRQIGDDTVEAEIEAKYNPYVLDRLMGTDVTISVVARALTESSTGAEIAFAIDTTNSMSFDSKWDAAIDAIENVLEEIEANSGDNIYVGLVPFQDRVNIGTNLTSTGRTSWVKGSLPTNPSPDDWRGCVEPNEQKIGTFDWALDDEKPPHQKWAYSTKYLPGGMGESNHNGIRCPEDTLVSPTTDIESVIDELKSLHINGTGRYDVGLAWAWRMVSPNWKGQWGAGAKYPTSDLKERKKYVVFMTDGMSTAYKHEMSEEEDLGTNMGTTVGFQHVADLCSRIKATGVEIYMAHVPGNSHSTSYFKSCASSDDHYFYVTHPDDLKGIFEDIADGHKSEVRLTQ